MLMRRQAAQSRGYLVSHVFGVHVEIEGVTGSRLAFLLHAPRHINIIQDCPRRRLAKCSWEALNVHFANVHFYFVGRGGSSFGGFELEWSLVATSLEGFFCQ